MSRDYTTVTETWGLPASPEQLAMQYFRYRMGAELVHGGVVLEIGCGSGMGLPYLQAHAPGPDLSTFTYVMAPAAATRRAAVALQPHPVGITLTALAALAIIGNAALLRRVL